jgi:uncharacterized protein YdaU (DUF1376 family)
MPWYPLYHGDFAMDTMAWTALQVGCLIRLMNHQWANGFVPNHNGQLAAICGVSEREFKKIWSALRPKFETLSRGKLVNRRLAIEHERQTKKREQAQAAIRKRWDDHNKKKGLDTDVHTDTIPSSESESDTDSKNKKEGEASPPLPDALNREAWDTWLAYRRESRMKKLVPRTVKSRTKMLAQFTHAEQQAIIDHSISNGYQGLFPQGALGGGNGRRVLSSPAEEIERATGVKRL